ncbi:hypothetical protein GGR56DRAFT_641305 [Xylariaceae sp. FL0804]|nr:hypothetical protein GGR56DRAFT_641305 [Xylariaceae sp. FL0804]
MAPVMAPRAAVMARSQGLSSGDIAGAVVGSVLGGSLLLIILGFLYFRHRRMTRQAQADGAVPISKASVSQQRPWPGILSARSTWRSGQRPPSDKGLSSEPAGPARDATAEQQPTVPPATGDGWMESHVFEPDLLRGQAASPPPESLVPGRQQTFPQVKERDMTQPLDQTSTAAAAANASYYDMRISMDSQEGQEFTAPSRQMTEMYKAQMREAEEYRKRSGSLPRRILNKIKRKRSTNSSAHDPRSPTQPYFPNSPVETPGGTRLEPGASTANGMDWQPTSASNRFYEEPEEMSEGLKKPGTSSMQRPAASSASSRDHKRQRRGLGDSQDSGFMLRTNSAIRETTERDPELPSSVLRTDSTYGLPPVAQPQPPAQPQVRLKSPDIPEPMEAEALQSTAQGHPSLRSSHSPPLRPESFVNPMAVHVPTNAAEKAAYTDYQMENSASPPTILPTTPQIVAEPSPQEQYAEPASDDDHDVDQWLDLPEDDEPRLSGDSYGDSTTPGQSTNPSSGRTPDTRITASPSPFPPISERVKVEEPSPFPPISERVKVEEPEASASPESSSVSLICEECGRTFDQIHKLNHHKRYHDRKHECPYAGCDRKFGTKTHLDRHINDKHEKSRAFHCTEPSCQYFRGGKAFPRKDNWRRHMIKKHGAQAQQLDAMDQSTG